MKTRHHLGHTLKDKGEDLVLITGSYILDAPGMKAAETNRHPSRSVACLDLFRVCSDSVLQAAMP